MDDGMPAALQKRLETFLIAICTNCMRRFAVLHSLLRYEGKKALPQVLKLIALLISVPCFQGSYFFFKLAYLLNHYRLRRLCSEDFFLEFYNGVVPPGPVVNVLQCLCHIEGGLERASTHHCFAYH